MASINYDFRPLVTRCVTVPCTSLKEEGRLFSQASDYEDFQYFKNSNMQYDIEDRLHNTRQSLQVLYVGSLSSMAWRPFLRSASQLADQ